MRFRAPLPTVAGWRASGCGGSHCCSALGHVKGLSENIRVRSVLGRFLGIRGMFAFENGGDPIVYIGSAVITSSVAVFRALLGYK